MRSLLGLLFCLLFSISSYSQSQIVLIDAVDSLLISNALIKITDAEGETQRHLSNENGLLKLDKPSYPLIIRIEHFAFFSVTDTLVANGNYPYYLRYKNNFLAEVSVTSSIAGQNKSLTPFRTTIIDSTSLSASQSTNLQDALRAQVNIRINRDASLSSSTASVMGIGGNNVKILQDGIPLSGHTGQDFDISQIPVQEISRIEIIEGPMSVEYGSNAQMGLINIISKNNYTRNTLLQFNVTEQTIENKYGVNSGVHDWNVYT
ncbi:MAG: TonB-dependent receptor, partial [Bacteroidia bacterium]|nr:TonB-dependent receptor [Bacteroidia bacterium]